MGRKLLVFALLILATIFSIAAIETSVQLSAINRIQGVHNSQLVNNLFLRLYATTTGAICSFAFSVFIFLSRGDRKKWVNAGLDEPIVSLLMTQRGARSRFKILSALQEPRHRGFISDATGIDWREVDREIGVLQEHGLVQLVEKKGRTEIYDLTGKGIIALRFLQSVKSQNSTE